MGFLYFIVFFLFLKSHKTKQKSKKKYQQENFQKIYLIEMPALTDIQLRVDKWSKCTLVGSVLLFVYSLLILVASIHADREYHHHHQRHGGEYRQHPEHQQHHRHQHQHGRYDDAPCRLHHFAVLGLLTSITGMGASFKNRKGFVLAFIILTLITEISALGYIGFQNARAVNTCTSVATTERVQLRGQEVVFPNGQKVEQISVVRAEATVNQPILEDCMKNVRHASVIASLIVGVVACSLACCGSRFSTALTEREEEEIMENNNSNSTSSCVVVGGEYDDVMMKPVVAILVSNGDEQQQKEQPQLI